jgi:polyhydroxyalkanoate synthesis regulator phasin
LKTNLLFAVLLLIIVAPGAVAALDERESNARTRSGQLLVTPVEQAASPNVPTGPAVVANEPNQALQGYASVTVAITQKFSASLAAIAEAVKRGELNSEQAREISIEQYQLAQMQFELVSLWREIEEQGSARIPDVQANSDPRQENEVVVVALPFSSLQLKPSLAEYLNLTQSQVRAIKQVMEQEQQNLDPLMTELRSIRDKLLTNGSEHISEKEIKVLADREASVLAKLIVASARLQSKIYRILSREQQKKLSDFERTQGIATMGPR